MRQGKKAGLSEGRAESRIEAIENMILLGLTKGKDSYKIFGRRIRGSRKSNVS